MYALYVFNGGLIWLYTKMYLFKMIIPSLQRHESRFQVFQSERLSLFLQRSTMIILMYTTLIHSIRSLRAFVSAMVYFWASLL
mgnify:CR=1 FL=1